MLRKQSTRHNLLVLLIALLVVSLTIACTGGNSAPTVDRPGGTTTTRDKETETETDQDSDSQEQQQEEETQQIPQLASPQFEPITFTGSGDDIVVFDGLDYYSIAYIKGNSRSRHFAVVAYGANQTYLDLLVNTTDPYEGIVFLDIDTVEFEVTATGSWEIEIRPLVTARVLGSSSEIDYADAIGKIEGSGDEVIIVVTLEDAPITAISGNESKRHFAVRAYGDRTSLLVNTTEVYSGRVRLPSGEFVILEVIATGKWAIELD